MNSVLCPFFYWKEELFVLVRLWAPPRPRRSLGPAVEAKPPAYCRTAEFKAVQFGIAQFGGKRAGTHTKQTGFSVRNVSFLFSLTWFFSTKKMFFLVCFI
jgi:hypothetical protein